METDAKDAAKPASRKDEEGSGSSKEQGSGSGSSSSDGRVEMVEADLVQLLREGKIEYAVHQANCTSRGAQGLAQALFKAFPTANIYQHRIAPDIPGTLRPTHKPGVVHLCGQFHLGPPSREEPASVRVHYFQSSLEQLAQRVLVTKLPPNKPIVLGIPHLIGCRLAGGDWAVYKAMIEGFARAVRGKARVLIVKLPEVQQAAAAAATAKGSASGGGGGGGGDKKRQAQGGSGSSKAGAPKKKPFWEADD